MSVSSSYSVVTASVSNGTLSYTIPTNLTNGDYIFIAYFYPDDLSSNAIYTHKELKVFRGPTAVDSELSNRFFFDILLLVLIAIACIIAIFVSQFMTKRKAQKETAPPALKEATPPEQQTPQPEHEYLPPPPPPPPP